MSRHTKYTPEVADAVIAALESGKRSVSIAPAIGVDRSTMWDWRKEHPEFDARWKQAQHCAGERLEEILYSLALSGDMEALRYWLRAYRPMIHDRAAIVKLAMLQASLVAMARKGGGGEPPILELDHDGLPVVSPVNGGGMSLEQPKSIMVITIPDNGRSADDVPAETPADDGSGRTMKLPRQLRAVTNLAGEPLTLVADGVRVPPGAVASLWARVRAFNEFCRASGPLAQARASRQDSQPFTDLEPEAPSPASSDLEPDPPISEQ